MENNIDLVELADYCQQQYKEKSTVLHYKSYVKTFYVAISEDKKISVSSTHHILRNAFQCILVHQSYEKAASCWYNHYLVQFIDETGCVHDRDLDEKYSIEVWPASFNCLERMKLFQNDEPIYECYPPFEKEMGTIWALYLKCKECATTKEAELLGKLTSADKKILELERDIHGLTYQNELLEKINKKYENILQKIEEALPKE